MARDNGLYADDRAALSRREILRLSAAGAVALGAAACSPNQPSAPPTSAKPPTQAPSLTPSPTPSASPSAASPSTLPVQHRAVHTLKEYRQMVPGSDPFPSNAVALTIDDGPDPRYTPKILRLLEKLDIKVTFCQIGQNAKGHADLAKAIASEGHHIANHTYTHPQPLSKKPLKVIKNELETAQSYIENASGYAPHLFRSPGGDWSPTIFKQAAGMGLLCIDWEVDPKDWTRPGVDLIRLRLLKAKPGDILLCHDGGGDRSQTYAALTKVLPVLKSRGLQFVPLPNPKA